MGQATSGVNRLVLSSAPKAPEVESLDQAGGVGASLGNWRLRNCWIAWRVAAACVPACRDENFSSADSDGSSNRAATGFSSRWAAVVPSSVVVGAPASALFRVRAIRHHFSCSLPRSSPVNGVARNSIAIRNVSAFSAVWLTTLSISSAKPSCRSPRPSVTRLASAETVENRPW